MKKISIGLALALILFNSCASLNNFLNPDYSVHYDLSAEEVSAYAKKSEEEKNYLKRFTAKDGMGKLHEVIIYDDCYLKMDGHMYAFRYDNLMYYKLSLNLFGHETNIDGSEKVIGFTCWATSLTDPELTVHMIIAREIFAKKHYKSQYEASQINGVYFAGRRADDGYIDVWGHWQKYQWKDYYEQIFGTVEQDVKWRMYMTVEAKS